MIPSICIATYIQLVHVILKMVISYFNSNAYSLLCTSLVGKRGKITHGL